MTPISPVRNLPRITIPLRPNIYVPKRMIPTAKAPVVALSSPGHLGRAGFIAGVPEHPGALGAMPSKSALTSRSSFMSPDTPSSWVGRVVQAALRLICGVGCGKCSGEEGQALCEVVHLTM